MIDQQAIADILAAHDAWVASRRGDWRRYRNAYAGNFWEDHKEKMLKAATDAPEPILVETNMLRQEQDSMVAGMFHRGLRSAIRPDDVVREGAKLDEPGKVADLISLICDRWLGSEEVEAIAEQGFRMGLSYDDIGFKVGMDVAWDAEDSQTEKDRNGHPLEQVWVDVLPAWEVVLDRKARSVREMRYIGHVHYMSAHKLEVMVGKSDLITVKQPDIVQDGKGGNDTFSTDEGYVRVLEFYDLTGTYKDDDGRGRQGVFHAFLLGQKDGGGNPETGLMSVHEGPVPYTNWYGQPLPPLLPMALVPLPEFPFMGVPHVATTYARASERNWATTFLANFWRRVVAPVLLVNGDAFVDDEAISAIIRGDIGALAKIEGMGKGADLGKVATWLEQQGVHPGVLEYIQHLDASASQEQLTAETTRGRAVPYASATEILALNDYSETNTGMFRKRMDLTVSKLCAMYLRVLAAIMDERKQKSFKMRFDGEEVVFKREWFDFRWEITLADFAASPISQAQRRGDFGAVGDKLVELAQIASDPEASPIAQKMAQLEIDYIVDLWELPENMRWAHVSAGLPATAEPPPAPEAAPGPTPPGAVPGALPPEMALPPPAPEDIQAGLAAAEALPPQPGELPSLEPGA